MASTPFDLNGISLISEDSPATSTVTNSSPPLVISNIASLIPIKLSSTNYMLWKSLFEPILCGHKLMHLIDDSTLTPITPDSPLYKKDQMLLSWINVTLSEFALPSIVGVSFAKATRNLLKTSVSEDDIVLYVLDGLPPSYQQFCPFIQIRARITALPLEELHTLLICEEPAPVDESPNENSTAFVAYRLTKPNVGHGNSS
ncbi:hypothetical protein NE237_011104 [Protea cynaroides]|uniref:Retrotransposon Copia-like N-terminal domain-containing protein n=1 Tax=Protea cynaroides TaxID=273540 RepID=A0A9Q0GUB6_9MAGN|nr:hypothetical protein NE237_011104 [Protea cynaroides]